MANKHHSHKVAMTLVGGLVAAAATGVYFLYGSKNAKKYRSSIKSWMFKAKADILDEIQKLETVSEAQYQQIVDMVMEKYKTAQNIDMDDVNRFIGDMKKQWKVIAKSVLPKKSRASKKK